MCPSLRVARQPRRLSRFFRKASCSGCCERDLVWTSHSRDGLVLCKTLLILVAIHKWPDHGITSEGPVQLPDSGPCLSNTLKSPRSLRGASLHAARCKLRRCSRFVTCQVARSSWSVRTFDLRNVGRLLVTRPAHPAGTSGLRSRVFRQRQLSSPLKV